MKVFLSSLPRSRFLFMNGAFFLKGIILTKLSEEMFVNFQSFLITFCLNCRYDFYEIERENRSGNFYSCIKKESRKCGIKFDNVK